MIHNQKGNALITVLLISFIFTALGLAIISSSISGTKRVENRESDINVSYNAMKVVDEMTANITKSLDTFNLKDFRGKPDESFNQTIRNLITDAYDTITESEKEKIECVTFVDESGDTSRVLGPSDTCIDDLSSFSPYHIDTDQDFTRVIEMVLVTNNPNQHEGKIRRTIRKRIILSPIPSFLKYAVGSSSTDDFGLFLNGSPNLKGNVYANRLTINEEANYQLRDHTWQAADTPMPSIVGGDLYSSTANLLEIIKDENNFYKKEVPALKHDSQFVDIDFKESFLQQANKILADDANNFSPIDTDIGNGFKDQLVNRIGSLPFYETPESIVKKEDDEGITASYILNSDDESFTFNEPVTVDGDLVVTSTSHSITFNETLVVNGDLYVVSYYDVSLSNVYVTGNIHLINYGGKLVTNNNILCGDTLTIESNGANGIVLNGDIITGDDLHLNPVDTTIKVSKNIVANGSFMILGNDELDQAGDLKENDEVIFSSVVYAGRTASISNVNILGADNRELILLAKSNLMITRINEFNNFNPSDENEKYYLPEDGNSIKPLKAFFYTESNAELYGVGSLFYIEGGLFAKKKLVINAVRGEVSTINNLPPKFDQEDKLSRFIVKYNEDILLQKIDALPIVEHLQMYSDELIVE